MEYDTKLSFDYLNHPDFVEYYETHRNKIEDLYPSEIHFIPTLAQQVKTILDVGCAGGGFYNIWKLYNPSIVYTGLDQSRKLIDFAEYQYHWSDSTFVFGDFLENSLFAKESFDLVAGLGLLPWNYYWYPLLIKMWSLTRKCLFFDIRIADEEQYGFQEVQINSGKSWDRRTAAPYIVLSWKDFPSVCATLDPRPISISQYGYWGKPSPTVHDAPEEIYFQTVVLEKGEPSSEPN